MHITPAHLENLVEERYRKRGEQYYADGIVELTSVTDKKAVAKCAGTRLYTTTINLNGNSLSGKCSCPAFDDFGPCKHMAATAYAVMNKKNYAPSEAFHDIKEMDEQLQRVLQRKTKAELIDIIYQYVADDPDLYDYLVEN